MIRKCLIKLLPVLIFVIMILSLTGCIKDTSPEGIVETELNLIKKLDEDTIRSFVSYEDMMRTNSTSSDIDSETTEAVRLFFQNFDYKILSSSTDDSTATVNVQITNIDAKALAKDLCTVIIENTVYPSKEINWDMSMSTYFSLLRDILSENSYELVTTVAHFELVSSDEGWFIQASEKLEDELVGGFISYLNDQNLITPEEVVTLTLDSLKSLTPEEWVTYLGLNDIFVTTNVLYEEIDLALAKQISSHFDYVIKEARIQDTEAEVDVEITSVGMEDVLTIYLEKLLEYAETTESVRTTDAELADKTAEILLECLENNTQTTTQTVTLYFNNNGYNWETQLDDNFTNALLGNFTEAMENFQASAAG